ncbi:MAG TPA: hypothetical protein DCZ94_07035 [Lentisphaeria bacterium]|nr:MAG: hypothetical protein A2X48_10350 [Lentisphaerae bacterium GWF2_49_21]HBC86689.1 hypothetical protein [Lentisphaeria bacterium]
MAIKVVCSCGMEVITFQKKPGEVLVCKKCGNQIVIPHVVENETQVHRDIGTSTVEGTYHAKKQESSNLPETRKFTNPPVPLKKGASPQSSSSNENYGSPTPPPVNSSKGAPGKKVCPDCLEESKSDSVICVECGYNFMTGRRMEGVPSIPDEKSRKSGIGLAINSRMILTAGKVLLLLLVIGSCVGYVIHFLRKSDSPPRQAMPQMTVTYSQPVADSGNAGDSNGTGVSMPAPSNHENGPFSSWLIALESYWVKDNLYGMISGELIFSDGKVKPINVKLYRGMQRNGSFKLIAEKLFRGDEKFNYSPNKVQGTTKIYLSDMGKTAENSNCTYYKIEVCEQNGKLLKAFPPVKAFLYSKPVISDKGWSWSPYPDGEKIENGYIAEVIKLKDGKTVICSPHDLKEAVSGEFPEEPRKFSMNLRIKVNRNECWRSKEPAYPEQEERTLDFKLFDASPNENPAKYVLPYFNDSDRYIESNLKSNTKFFFQKVLLDGKDVPVDTENSRTHMFFIGSPMVTLTYAIADVSVNPPAIIKKDTIEFIFPPNPPMPKISSDENGIALSWDDCAKRFEPKNFLSLPKIGIYRNEQLIKTCELKETSFVDNDQKLVYGNEYTYHLAFTNCIMRTQGYVEGLKVKDFYLDIYSINRPFSSNGNRGYSVFCKANKGQSATTAVSRSKGNQRPPRIPMEGPLTVGLLKEEMCFKGTGLLEVALYTKVVESLLKEKDIEVMDRVNSDKILKMMIEKLPKEKRDRFWLRNPDFAVRLRDYSDETGNGVELWLTRLTDGWTNAVDSQSWRIGRIGLNDVEAGKYDQLTASLVSKIRELAAKSCNVSAPAGEKLIIPKNIIYTPFLPVEQPDQILQYKSISESIVFGASDKLLGQSLLSREDWGISIRERLLLENSGVSLPPDAFADLLISGRMWKEKDKTSYLFMATDLMSTRVVDSLCLSGNIDDVASAIGKWCSSLKVCKAERDPLLQAGKQIFLDNIEELGIFYGMHDMDQKLPSAETAADGKSALSMASEIAKAGDYMMAINILEQAWSSNRDNRIGEQLAMNYHSAGMYALEVELLNELSKRGVNVNPDTLNRAKSLAGSSSILVATDSAVRKKRVMTPVAVNPTISDKGGARFSTRKYWADEWFTPENPIFTAKFEKNTTVQRSEKDFFKLIQGIAKYPNARIPFYDSESQMDWKGTAMEYLGFRLEKEYASCVRNKYSFKLEYLFAADVLAKNNIAIGTKVVNEAKAWDVVKTASVMEAGRTGNAPYDSLELVIYRAYAGDEKALAFMSDPKWLRKVFYEYSYNPNDIRAIVFQMLAEAGREKALAAILANDRRDRRVPRYSLRNVNKEFMKKFIVQYAYLFEAKERARLFEGFGLAGNIQALIGVPIDPEIHETAKSAVLLYGRPFKEVIADMETKYYAENK